LARPEGIEPPTLSFEDAGGDDPVPQLSQVLARNTLIDRDLRALTVQDIRPIHLASRHATGSAARSDHTKSLKRTH